VERRGIRHEEVADEFRPVEQMQLDRPEPKAHHISVLARDFRQEREGIPPHREQVAPGETARRARGPGHRIERLPERNREIG
jgi:hypothetical protein